MNIWYLSHYAGGPGIGKAHRAFHLARAWAALGHTATIFPARYHHLLEKDAPLPDEIDISGVRYAPLDARRYTGNDVFRLLNIFDYCRSAWRLARTGEARFGRPDAIIVSSPHPFAIYPAARLAKKFGAKLVFEVRDLWPLSITEINGSSRWHPFVLLTGLTERFAYRCANLVASQLGAAEPLMRERGLKPGKFVFVPNGIDPSPEPTEASSSVSETALAAEAQISAWKREGRLIVIHPGSQGAPNALDRLLDAVALLKSSGQEERFGIILLGHGAQTEALKIQCAKLGLSSVAFFGSVPKGDALSLTALADIGYAGARDHAAVYRYGISFNKIMDFMQAGLPVLLPLTAAGDPVTASGCGIVTGNDSPEAIADALKAFGKMTAEERVSMGEKGRSLALSEYDYRQIARRYAEAIANSN
ncbi:MAG TPA: glycosyltransferase family 4 protein [Rhizobiaceae bacterium]|nr:glycosyltransferase family 4 protein [Rhizobiaceae bacterium]